MPVAMRIDPNGNPIGIFDTEKGIEQINMTQNLNLYKKLAAMMSELGWISKGKTVDVGGGKGYDYTSEAQYVAECRPLFVKHRLLMFPTSCNRVETESFDKGQGKVSYLTTVEVYYQIVDLDSGESIVVVAAGQGTDSGDKGVYKALTGAWKYALRQTFMIGSGDDPENYDDEGRVVARDNGKAETPTERGKRVINEMYAELEDKHDIDVVLKQLSINLNRLPEDKKSMLAVYNLLANAKAGMSALEMSERYATEMGVQ